MALALFDLDNTLIGGDSDHLWGEFIVEQNIVDGSAYAQKNDAFYQDYKSGQLDIIAYLEFALSPLTQLDPSSLSHLHHQFFEKKIRPIWLTKAESLVEEHRNRGDTLVVITATNRFITEPITKHFGINHLIASEGEIMEGRYTGKVLGTPCFHEGKVARLSQWQKAQSTEWDTTYFYSDSFNDIPLLRQVEQPYAVDPDPKLKQYAEDHAIPIISLR